MIIIILSILLIVLSIATIYQTKVLKKTRESYKTLQEKVQNIEKNIDTSILEKQEKLESINSEIELAEKKAEYIKIDQVEMNKEYEYLQQRNKELGVKVLYQEEKIRYSQCLVD